MRSIHAVPDIFFGTESIPQSTWQNVFTIWQRQSASISWYLAECLKEIKHFLFFSAVISPQCSLLGSSYTRDLPYPVAVDRARLGIARLLHLSYLYAGQDRFSGFIFHESIGCGMVHYLVVGSRLFRTSHQNIYYVFWPEIFLRNVGVGTEVKRTLTSVTCSTLW